MRKFTLILFVVCVAILQVSSFAVSARDSFRVGLECDYAPFNWTQTDNSNDAVEIKAGGGFCGGYDVEIAKIIAQGLDRDLVIVKTTWDGLIPSLNAGKIDAVIAGMSPTEERKFSVDFSAPYYESDLVIVIKKDGNFANAKNIQDFSGAKITAQLSTFHETVISQINGVKKQTSMETFPAMIVALKSGKIDGYISERPGAISAVSANPELTYISFEDSNGFEASPEDVAIAVALKKGGLDLVKIDEILVGLDKDQRNKLMDNAIAVQPVSQ